MLSYGTTPYEVMNHAKLDLSHLWVWECQCFPAIPPELVSKVDLDGMKQYLLVMRKTKSDGGYVI